MVSVPPRNAVVLTPRQARGAEHGLPATARVSQRGHQPARLRTPRPDQRTKLIMGSAQSTGCPPPPGSPCADINQPAQDASSGPAHQARHGSAQSTGYPLPPGSPSADINQPASGRLVRTSAPSSSCARRTARAARQPQGLPARTSTSPPQGPSSSPAPSSSCARRRAARPRDSTARDSAVSPLAPPRCAGANPAALRATFLAYWGHHRTPSASSRCPTIAP